MWRRSANASALVVTTKASWFAALMLLARVDQVIE
jgi:hypothetical protein